MYSLHGFDALIRPEFLQVCQRLIVVSNWTPGSAQAQAASAIWRHRSRAFTFFITSPFLREVSAHISSFITAAMKSCGTRTELFEF